MRISDWSSDVCSSDLIGPDTRAEFLAIVDRSSPDIIRNGSVEEITVNSEVGAVTVDHSFSDRNSLRAGLLVTNTRSFWDARGRDRSANNRILSADHYPKVPVTGGLRYDRSEGRRVGTEGGRTCSSRWSPYCFHKKTNHLKS